MKWVLEFETKQFACAHTCIKEIFTSVRRLDIYIIIEKSRRKMLNILSVL